MPRKPETAPEAEATPPFAVKDVTFAGTQQVAALAPLKSPAERAVLALNSTERETSLVELVKKSADIVEVKNPDARAQVHRMAMDLKNARVEIEKEAKAARDDATKFSKAVIAEEGRLITITSAEEDRLLKLRDDFDAEQKRIAEEERVRNEARIAAIRAKIDAITALPREHAAADSTTLTEVVKGLAARKATKEEFAELTDEAELAMKATADALLVLRDAAIKTEQEKQRIADEAAANKREAERLAAERLKSEQAAKEVADAAAALKLAQEQQQRTMRAVQVFNYSAGIDDNALMLSHELDRVRSHKIDESEFGAGVDMVKMARDMAIKTLEQRYAQAVAVELPAAYDEALELNAQFDAERDAVAPMSELPETGYITTNPDGSVRFHADAPAPAAEPAPEPAPLPLPESHSPVDELIDAGLFETPTDDEIMELIECEYGWTRDQTIRRLRVVLANCEERVAA